MPICSLKCVFGMSGLVFGMSGLVFWMSGLVFGCLDLYFRCLDLHLDVWTWFLSVWTCVCVCVGGVFGCLDSYLGVWTCILYTVYLESVCILVGCDYGMRAPPPPAPRGLCACRRRFFFLKNDAPGIFEHVYCQFSRFSWIWGSPGQIFKKWTICSNDYAS